MTETAERVITPVVLAKSKRDRLRFAKAHKAPIVIAAAVLAAFGLGFGLGTTFTSGPSRAGAGVVAHDSKAKHPGGKTGSSTTTTSTTTTSTTTTTTTTTPPPTAEQAASHLDSTIENGVAKGTIPTPLAEQLTAIVQPLLAPTQNDSPPQTDQFFYQLEQQFDQAVASGQVTDATTIHQVDAALGRLATTLGIPTAASTGQPGPGQPTGQGGGNGHGHGHGNGNG